MKLRYLPTNDELREMTLSKSQRERRKAGVREPTDRVIYEAVRILLRQGLNISTCPMYYIYEAVAEAKDRLGPDPLIS